MKKIFISIHPRQYGKTTAIAALARKYDIIVCGNMEMVNSYKRFNDLKCKRIYSIKHLYMNWDTILLGHFIDTVYIDEWYAFNNQE